MALPISGGCGADNRLCGRLNSKRRKRDDSRRELALPFRWQTLSGVLFLKMALLPDRENCGTVSSNTSEMERLAKAYRRFWRIPAAARRTISAAGLDFRLDARAMKL